MASEMYAEINSWGAVEILVNERVQHLRNSVEDLEIEMRNAIETAKSNEIIKTLTAMSRRLSAIEEKLAENDKDKSDGDGTASL